MFAPFPPRNPYISNIYLPTFDPSGVRLKKCTVEKKQIGLPFIWLEKLSFEKYKMELTFLFYVYGQKSKLINHLAEQRENPAG